jgi:ribokinase
MGVIVVGSLNIDLVVHLERMPNPGETLHGKTFHTYPGGKGLNQAVAAARSSAATSMIGVLGTDPYSDSLRGVLDTESINSELVATIEGPCGTAVIEVDSAGQNRIVVIPGANAELDASKVLDQSVGVLRPGTVVVTQLESPANQLTKIFQHAQSAGCLTILNPAPASELSADFLRAIDILIPNQFEAELLTGIEVSDQISAAFAARALIEQGVKAVIVTLGSAGAIYVSQSEEIYQPAFAVVPIDTTAAGDAFCGAFAAELERGAPIASALRYGCGAGALATTAHGAVPSIPIENDIRALLSSQGV